MNLAEDLGRRLAALRAQALYRELNEADSAQGPRFVLGGASVLNFSSNDYLGLANDPMVKAAAIRAVEEYGAGSGASRLVCGSLAPHHALERTLAGFKGTEAALSFSSGFAAALGTICAVMGEKDVIVLDKLVHACIVDAARQSGAKLRVFAHNDVADLGSKLRWAAARRAEHPEQRILVVTESVFSMDGDRAPLEELVRLKRDYEAWLMVDEAHATGVLGHEGRGLADELGVADEVDIQMGTLGKAAGAAGGYVCGPKVLIDFLLNRARSFIFSTAPPPAAAAAARAGIERIRSAEGQARRSRLRGLVARFLDDLNIQGRPFSSAIVPLVAGAETEALRIAQALRSRGILVPAIRYPTVARGAARLRITFTAAHTAEDIASLVAAFRDLKLEVRPAETHLRIA